MAYANVRFATMSLLQIAFDKIYEDDAYFQTGYIRTSEDNYYIHPVERYQDQITNGTILHIIKKVPHKSEKISNDVEDNSSGVDSCETKGKWINVSGFW